MGSLLMDLRIEKLDRYSTTPTSSPHVTTVC